MRVWQALACAPAWCCLRRCVGPGGARRLQCEVARDREALGSVAMLGRHPGGVMSSCHPGGGWLAECSNLRYVLLAA